MLTHGVLYRLRCIPSIGQPISSPIAASAFEAVHKRTLKIPNALIFTLERKKEEISIELVSKLYLIIPTKLM